MFFDIRVIKHMAVQNQPREIMRQAFLIKGGCAIPAENTYKNEGLAEAVSF